MSSRQSISDTLLHKTTVKNILESISDAFISLDKNWRFTYINRQARNVFKRLNIKTTSLKGENIWQKFPGARNYFFYKKVTTATVQKKAIEFEEYYPVIKTWFEFHVYPSIDGVSIYFRDISERKEAEHALKESEEKYRQLFENIPIGIYRATVEGKILMANPAMVKMLGYQSFEEFSQASEKRTGFSLAYPQKQFKYLLQKQGELKGVEIACRRNDNSLIYIQENSRAVRDDDGSVLYYEGTVEDITERKIIEDGLKESEERYRLLVECVYGYAIFMVSTEGKIISWNIGAERLTGYSADEVVGRHVSVLDTETSNNESFDQQYKCADSIGRYENEGWKKKKNDERYWAYMVMAPMRGEYEELKGFSVLIHDLTEQKQIEQRKDEFIGVASHELKTPLTSVKAFTQILQKRFQQVDDKTSLLYLSKIDHQLEKLTNLVRDLLDVSKMTSGRLEFDMDKFDLDNLIEEIVDDLQSISQKHQIVWKNRIQKIVCGDKDRIGQVLINLISNAIKYSPYASKVVVDTYEQGSEVVVSVQDFGIGIAKKYQSQIFERFFRVSGPLAGSFPGLGIGLYIASEIVNRHDGRMWVESTPGKGSTFYFSIPNVSKLVDNVTTEVVEAGGVALSQ